MRRFAGHAALAVAAFASLATSKPGWRLAASPPPTQIADELGTLAIVEASRRPDEARCIGPSVGELPAARRSEAGTRYELVCPPGTHISEVAIGGKEGKGCSKPEPPPGEYVRFVELKPIKMWRAEATETLHLVTQDLDGHTTHASQFVEIGGAVIATVDAKLAEADPAIEPPHVQSYGPLRFGVTIFAPGTSQRRGDVAVHAIGWGICEQDCTPGQLTIASAR